LSCGEVPVAAPAVGAFHRPYGTEIHSLPNPALKRRATIRRPSGARLRKARLRLVPEGPLVVARHFSGGYVRDCEMRAVGTPDMTTDAGENVFQPSLRDGVYYNALAAINRRATIRRPSGRGYGGSFEIGPGGSSDSSPPLQGRAASDHTFLRRLLEVPPAAGT
jgi:hypothetical protein